MTATAHVDVDGILQRARTGGDAGFEELIREYEGLVYGIAIHSLRDRTLAEDVAQEVFLQLYGCLAEIASDAHLTCWLRRVTSHRCIDEIRRRRPHSSDSLQGLSIVEPKSDPILRRRLLESIAQLPDQQRLSVILRYQEEMEPAEISAALDIPLNTIKSHLRRALSLLRSRLTGNFL